MTTKYYKVRLDSGRVLGPINLDRIRKLIRRKKIIGTEKARLYPEGDWVDINSISEIAELFVKNAQGILESTKTIQRNLIPIVSVKKKPSEPKVVSSPEKEKTPIQKQPEILPGATDKGVNLAFDPLPEFNPEDPNKTVVLPKEVNEQTYYTKARDEEVTHTVQRPKRPEDEEKTLLADPKGGDQKIELDQDPDATLMRGGNFLEDSSGFTRVPVPKDRMISAAAVSDQATMIIPGGVQPDENIETESVQKVEKAQKRQKFFRILAILGLGIYLGIDFFLEPERTEVTRLQPLKPMLPNYESGKTDPKRSNELYVEGLKRYILDTNTGYRQSAELFLKSASLDSKNIKSIALLASTYLNLIDSSTKDDTYFNVISKLIEMTKAKKVTLPETVIAEVEFLIATNRMEQAQRKIVEYTNQNQNFGSEMFYYLALTFYFRADPKAAARYLSQIPDEKVFSVKVFYLRGVIAEKYGDLDQALIEYKKALKNFPNHAKSRLRIAEILKNRNQLKEAAPHIDYCVTHPESLVGKDLALAFYLQSLLAESFQKNDLALAAAERAVVLVPESHDYNLQVFQIKYKLGEKVEKYRNEARMYFFLKEGESFLRNGDTHRALTEFLQARQARDQSPVPLVKIGDMFLRLNDLSNARINYKLAADRAPNNIAIWAKYIHTLIESYEWDEAQRAMDRFRKLPVSQGAIDKLAGDLLSRQGRHREAQGLYKAALARPALIQGLYLAYGKSLLATRNFQDAILLFALALRQDPDHSEAVIGMTKCIAETESLDRALYQLNDEIKKSIGLRAELLTAGAEFELRRGNYTNAQTYLNQAINANPGFADAWRVQGLYYLQREGMEKNALDKALDAYNSYLQRNPSDANGYLERHKILIKKTKFEDASEELSKIYALYPKFPNLHFHKGALYMAMGNLRLAVEEFKAELKNNPYSVITLVTLGKVMNEANQPQDAMKYLNQAIQLDAKSGEAKHQLGYANYLQKNYAGAIALYLTALEVDKGNPTLYKRLGMAYRDAGDRERAAKNFKKYLEMEPDAPDKAEFAGYQ